MTRSTENTSGTKVFSAADYVKIAVFGFALSALWGSLHSLILQIRLEDFVAESQLNTYLSLLTGTGLILAMAVQPIAGAISDRSGFRWGRRRPFIVLGAALAILFLPGIGLAGSFGILFISYGLLQISSNIAQGPYQGFIPDLVPGRRRGLASGVKSLLEILGGVALLRLIGPFMGNYSDGEGSHWLWLSLGALAIVLVGALIATSLMVKERPASGAPRQPLLPALYKSFKIDVKLNRDFIWFLVSRLLILMAFATIQRFAFYYLKYYVGIADPAAATADLLIVVGISMVAAVYPAGRLSDRLGRKPIIITSGLIAALGIVMLFFADSHSSILVSSAVLGIASGSFMSVNWALATDLVAKGEAARYLGLTNLATAGAAALALFIIGPTIDYFNTVGPGLGYQIMLGSCFIYFVAGAFLVLKIKGQR